MSKYVKDLITKELASRLERANDALLVNVVGLDANKTVLLRRQLREKNIRLLVVKNSLAKRATEGTPLALAFEGAEGTLAVVWGAEDVVSLAKEVTRLATDDTFAPFAAAGGVMDGERLSADRVKEISKWPSRAEQLGLLVAQLLSPGANLASQLVGPAGLLAGQIDKKSQEVEEN